MSMADRALYLDDLFRRPAARGRGVARALISFLADEVMAGEFALARWTTKPDNTSARQLYDQIAEVADSVTYNLPRRDTSTTGSPQADR